MDNDSDEEFTNHHDQDCGGILGQAVIMAYSYYAIFLLDTCLLYNLNVYLLIKQSVYLTMIECGYMFIKHLVTCLLCNLDTCL